MPKICNTQKNINKYKKDIDDLFLVDAEYINDIYNFRGGLMEILFTYYDNASDTFIDFMHDYLYNKVFEIDEDYNEFCLSANNILNDNIHYTEEEHNAIRDKKTLHINNNRHKINAVFEEIEGCINNKQMVNIIELIQKYYNYMRIDYKTIKR